MWHNLALDLRICSWDALESSTLSSSHRSTSATYGLFQNKKTQTFTETFGLIFTLISSFLNLRQVPAHTIQDLNPRALTCLAGGHVTGEPTRPTAVTYWNQGTTLPSLLWRAPDSPCPVRSAKRTWLTMPSAIHQEATLAPERSWGFAVWC